MNPWDRYENVLTAFYSSPWAILPEKLDAIEAVLLQRVGLSDGYDRDAVLAELQRVADGLAPDAKGRPAIDAKSPQAQKPYLVSGKTAVVPVRGTITPRPSVFSSGGSSALGIGKTFDAALADKDVRSIVLDVDSPGGSVYGVPELADKLRAGRGVKPVYAVANHSAASAAYWIASQADKLYVAPSGEVGSIGVIMRHFDRSGSLEKSGVKVTDIRSAKYKGEGSPYGPLTDETKGEFQKQCNEYYKMFVEGVSAGRMVDGPTVEKSFGQGRMKLARDAVDCGMADGIATMDAVLGMLNAPGQSHVPAASAASAVAVAVSLNTRVR